MSSTQVTNLFGVDEEVVSSLEARTWGLYVTNQRIIYLQTSQDKKTRTLQDFDYKHITHIFCESTKGTNYSLIGLIVGIVGIFLGYLRALNQAFLWIGSLLFLGGLLATFSKTPPISILKIQLSGTTQTQAINIPTTAEEMDKILQSIAKMREKTTLRHDKTQDKVSE